MEFFTFIGIVWAVLMVANVIIKLVNTEDQAKELREKIASRIHPVVVETINSVHYVYDAENNKFLGQGCSLDEVKQLVKTRFPADIFLFDGEIVTALSKVQEVTK